MKTQPNQRQIFYFWRCIARARQWLNTKYFDLELRGLEMVHGRLWFMLSSRARKNTGMLFMCNKTVHFQIAPRGGVKTMTEKQDRFYCNKFINFIL